jgi:crotonobetainyl-CoA:carnitine CoA-transferase CaiB-like acyl-CoA transferase
VEQLQKRPRMEWFRELMEAGVPCGPINTVDGSIAFAEKLGMEPVVRAGQGEAAMPGVRNPITFSQTPPRYDLPPPGLDEHGDRIRRWLSQPAGAPVPQEGAD